MKSSFQVEIKEPCTQNWDHMTPNKDGRFCNSCQLNVIDFTYKTPNEISDYFKNHNNEPICGHLNSYDVKQHNRIDTLISRLNKNGFRYVSLVILGVLILSGCRTRKSTTTYANGRVLSDNKTNHKTEQTQHAIKSSKRS